MFINVSQAEKHCRGIEDLTNRAIGGQKGVFTYYYKAENFGETHSPLEEGHHLRILGKNNQKLASPYDYATYCKQQQGEVQTR